MHVFIWHLGGVFLRAEAEAKPRCLCTAACCGGAVNRLRLVCTDKELSAAVVCVTGRRLVAGRRRGGGGRLGEGRLLGLADAAEAAANESFF